MNVKPRHTGWHELTGAQKTRAVTLGAVQLALAAVTLIDLRRRPKDQVRGDKRLWTVLAFANVYGVPTGAIGYFLYGRKR